MLDAEGYKLDITDVSIYEYEKTLFVIFTVMAENRSEYDIEIDMSIESFGDYDVRETSSSASVLVSNGKKANGQMNFLLRGITDTTIKDFEFELSVWDKGRSLYNLYRTETLNGLLP